MLWRPLWNPKMSVQILHVNCFTSHCRFNNTARAWPGFQTTRHSLANQLANQKSSFALWLKYKENSILRENTSDTIKPHWFNSKTFTSSRFIAIRICFASLSSNKQISLNFSLDMFSMQLPHNDTATTRDRWECSRQAFPMRGYLKATKMLGTSWCPVIYRIPFRSGYFHGFSNIISS